MDKDNSFNFMEGLKINRSNLSSHPTNSRNFSTLSYRIHGHSKFRFGANVYHVSPQNMLLFHPESPIRRPPPAKSLSLFILRQNTLCFKTHLSLRHKTQ